METESVAAKEESIEDIEDFSARVADLLTEAGTASDAHVRVESLRTVSSMILHEDPTLLDNFLEEILAFKSDRAADVSNLIWLSSHFREFLEPISACFQPSIRLYETVFTLPIEMRISLEHFHGNKTVSTLIRSFFGKL